MANNPKGFDYVNEIWNIADYVRDVIRPADYNKLILPFAVLRRFECALEPTREAVSNMAKRGVWDDDDPKYCALSKHCFYNLTDFRLNNLGASNTLEALMGYVNGFGPQRPRGPAEVQDGGHLQGSLRQGNALRGLHSFRILRPQSGSGERSRDVRHLRAPDPEVRRGDQPGRRTS
ncbi:MAG: type I restriction-modification system subunit M N-terminal domain-containing protein [Gordonibacter pamelaeae]